MAGQINLERNGKVMGEGAEKLQEKVNSTFSECTE